MKIDPQKPYDFGKFRIDSPCPKPWDEMSPEGEGQRRCAHCQHTVYDISGMRPKQIEALYKRANGKLCGNFSVGNPPLDHDLPSPFRIRIVPNDLKIAASVAAMSFLLLHPAKLHAVASTAAAVYVEGGNENHTNNPATRRVNHQITAVILDQDSMEVRHDLHVHVFADGKIILDTVAVHGLFHADLEGQVSPNTMIEVKVLKQTIPAAKGSYYTFAYAATSKKALLNDAQNLKVVVQVDRPNYPKLGGAVSRPFR
jgi:hypothetical protein